MDAKQIIIALLNGDDTSREVRFRLSKEMVVRLHQIVEDESETPPEGIVLDDGEFHMTVDVVDTETTEEILLSLKE